MWCFSCENDVEYVYKSEENNVEHRTHLYLCPVCKKEYTSITPPRNPHGPDYKTASHRSSGKGFATWLK